jgi:hypothetical protein
MNANFQLQVESGTSCCCCCCWWSGSLSRRGVDFVVDCVCAALCRKLNIEIATRISNIVSTMDGGFIWASDRKYAYTCLCWSLLLCCQWTVLACASCLQIRKLSRLVDYTRERCAKSDLCSNGCHSRESSFSRVTSTLLSQFDPTLYRSNDEIPIGMRRALRGP